MEHRIQYLDDQQTHLLPTADADLGWIARSLGLACNADACELLDRLGEMRELVATEFDALLHDGQAPRRRPTAATAARPAAPGPLPVDSEALLEQLPPELAERVRQLGRAPARAGAARREQAAPGPAGAARRASACATATAPMAAALRFIDWLEPLLRRESYLALLVERPEVQNRLLRLLGLARWPMQYLMRHPGVIDELADERLLHERFDARRVQRRPGGAPRRLGSARARPTRRRCSTRCAAPTTPRSSAPWCATSKAQLTVEQVADDLSALADATLDMHAALGLDAPEAAPPRRSRSFAVIAYGKLGGKELGYGSDLDVVFLYDDADEADKDRAQEVYGAFVRKLITWLTLRTAAGELFDIDTALRPNGNSGLLVTSIDAFERYQTGRGSNTAWTWEHQALTRARFCAGARRAGARASTPCAAPC